MRHRKSGRTLSRSWEHRKAMFRNMAKSLIEHERIKTTLPKAKELSKVADRLVTLALRGDLSAKRQAYKFLDNHQLVKRLFDEIGPKFQSAQGGYTRVIKHAKPRQGDGSPMAMIEFTYQAGFDSAAPKPSQSKAQQSPVPPESKAAQSQGETSAVPEQDVSERMVSELDQEVEAQETQSSAEATDADEHEPEQSQDQAPDEQDTDQEKPER